jgi:FkbM family methyltransferase
MFCAANPRNQVVSFDPSPILCARLRAIRDLNSLGARMRIEQIGIGAKTGAAEMMVDPIGGFVQIQRFYHSMWANPEPIQIRIETIPDAAARLCLIPQFIKIDIEGYEAEAIHGAHEFLAKHKPTIFLELHLNYLEQRNLSPKVPIGMLRNCGYGFYTSSGKLLTTWEICDSPLPIVRFIAR